MHDHGRLHAHHQEPVTEQPIVRRRSIALGILCLCALTAGVDMTIANVALPSIGRAFDAATNELQWTIDAYNIVLAGMLVLGGALADRYGRRRVFLASYTLFAIASLAAAFSPSVGALIASRALMGLGAAGVTAPALAIIAKMYPPEERGRAIAAFVVFGATGLAVGPIAGGLLLDHFWWGSVFLVNVPIVAVGVLVGARTIPESKAPVPAGGQPPLDVTGAILSVVGLGALLFGIIEGPSRGWTSPTVLAGIVVGAAALATFVVRSLRIAAPLFDVRILGRPPVATGAITLLIAYLLFSSFLFLNPQYLQDVQGESIVSVGLLFVPFAVILGLCSLQAQRILQRLGPRNTIALGLVVTAVACAIFALALTEPLWVTIAASGVLGAGVSLLIAPPSTVVMNDLPETNAGDGSSLNFVSRFAGASIGVAIVGSIMATVYVNDLEDAKVPPLSSEQVDKSEGSLQGALEVAKTLDKSADSSLTTAAVDAFNRGAAVAYTSLAILAVIAAIVAWFALSRSSRRDHE
ncbi:MAG TPA: MFS transporter [Nocardioidaceae bacterium]|nr:MFS transporter [Nocardioidaceae bacterium]